jgi:ribosomal 50S subunit-recycling heat shock protein
MIGKLLLTNRLIYSRTLQSQNFCSHTPDTHNFEGYGVVASIKVETSDVLDIRLPQMQVGPNVVKRKSGRDAAEDALESLVSEDKRIQAQDQLTQEVFAYVKSVDVVMNRIVSLSTHFSD